MKEYLNRTYTYYNKAWSKPDRAFTICTNSEITGCGVQLVTERERERERERNEMTKVRIRRLTPKECWRLMDFPDEAYEKAAQVNSNSQLYKQAGNSIVVACLEHIFRNLFNEQTDEPIEEEPAQTINEEPKVLILWDLI